MRVRKVREISARPSEEKPVAITLESPEAQSANAQVVLRTLHYASVRDLNGFLETCAPDVILNFPFHPAGSKTYHGVDNMIRQFRAEETFATFELWADRLYDFGDTIIIEGRSHGTNSNDVPDYNNRYVFVVRCERGRVAEWTEYYNPLEAMKQGYGEPRPKKNKAA
jgi:ketosteroid isomerase-like protein